MPRRYARDARGRFAANGNTSRSARRQLQTIAGTSGAQRRDTIRGGLANQRRPNTIATSRSQRQQDAFRREMALMGMAKPRSYTRQKGVTAPRRIQEDQFALRPQRVGTISRRSGSRAMQSELRAELAGSGQGMAAFRQEYRKGRRYRRG